MSTEKRTLTRQSQFANLEQWRNHLASNVTDGDIVVADLDDEHKGETCHFRGVKGDAFEVQAEWDDWYTVDAKDIIEIEFV